MNVTHKGMKYLDSALKIALGAGAVLGSSYVLFRLRERQAMEARLDRLDQMVEKLVSVEEKESGAAREEEH